MSRVPALPRGWERWPEEQQLQLLAGLEALAQEREFGRGPWLCSRDVCDGKPHKGRMNAHSRSEQRPPTDPDWDTWNLLAGRGFGKTRTGAEWVIAQAKTLERGALVGPTAADVRDIMVEGESGILACARPSFRPEYQPSKRRLVYPNGSVQHCYSADEPDRLRGPQHHYAWADELAAWRYLQYAWDMLQMGLRLGEHPRACVTTTPRPLPLIKSLVKDTERVRTVRGSTYDNLHNLAPVFQRAVLDRYAGTTLGRQELDAEILEDLPGALVARKHIRTVEAAPDLDLVAVGVDPAGTGTGDEAGIVVAGRGTADRRFYVLADYSAQMSARETGLRAWRAFYDHGAAYIVYEDNFGKQWLRDGLVDAFADYHGMDAEERKQLHTQDAELFAQTGDDLISPFDPERKAIPNAHRFLRKVTAQHGKHLRAQPVAMRYEQGQVLHVGAFPEYEDQLTTWNPHESSNSPDRVDAAVHVLTDFIKREGALVTVVNPHAVAGRTSGIHPLERIRRRTA
jgi:phage terminase large subunit-like protein